MTINAWAALRDERAREVVGGEGDYVQTKDGPLIVMPGMLHAELGRINAGYVSFDKDVTEALTRMGPGGMPAKLPSAAFLSSWYELKKSWEEFYEKYRSAYIFSGNTWDSAQDFRKSLREHRATFERDTGTPPKAPDVGDPSTAPGIFGGVGEGVKDAGTGVLLAGIGVALALYFMTQARASSSSAAPASAAA